MSKELKESDKILEIIQDADHEDGRILNWIDAKFFCFLHGLEYLYYGPSPINKSIWALKVAGVRPDQRTAYQDNVIPPYTLSRDVLKSVRDDYLPNWFIVDCDQRTPETTYYALRREFSDGALVESPELPTEYLAELHVIIQALEWEKRE